MTNFNPATVTYMRRYNLGNYEHEEITLGATYDPSDPNGAKEAIDKLKETILLNSEWYRRAKTNKDRKPSRDGDVFGTSPS